MAIDAYMYFQDYNSKFQSSESQVAPTVDSRDLMWKKFEFDKAQGDGGLFEVEDFSFDVEQTLNIGSQSTGAGAGKITFNPFSITRKIDKLSPTLFQMACAGTPFQKVALGSRKASGGNTSGIMYLVFCFKLVAVKTISWSYDDESPKETVTFEYGGLQVHYSQQKADGSFVAPIPAGWNKVKNVKDDDPATLIR
ncbi:MAG: type VI secretion system tube protein Hcp [Blastocatellia bacterium]|nr:type VI secretion system tube protein Hcp [Blastocatellia bacterium]